MSLAQASTRGAAVFSAGNFASYGISLIATIAMARLVGPTNIGDAALAITVADFLVVTAAWSFPTALIREPEESVGVAFPTAVLLSIAMGAVVLLVATALGAMLWIVKGPIVGQILVAVMAGRIISMVGSCFAVDLQRRFAYGTYTGIQLGSQTASNAVCVALAATGAGAWALAGRDIAAALVAFALSVGLSRWRLTRRFSRNKARELLAFASKMGGSRLGDLMFHRYDNLIVGAIAGSQGLGLYSQAYVVAETGNKVYAPVLSTVPLSTYSRMQGDRVRTQRVYDLIMYCLVRGVVPIAVILFLFPKEILTVLLGKEWAPAEGILRGLSVYALLLPIFEHARAMMVANGAVGNILRARGLQLAVFLPGVPILVAFEGATGAAIAVAAAMVVGVIAILVYARSTAVFAVRRNLLAPGVAAGAGIACALLVLDGIDDDVGRILAGGTTFVAIYLFLLVAIDGRELKRTVSLLRLSIWPSDTTSSPLPGTADEQVIPTAPAA